MPAAAERTQRPSRFVGCGLPLPGHELRVVDAAGHEVAERQEGRLQFRGPSATSGYFRDAEATAACAHGDWLDSRRPRLHGRAASCSSPAATRTSSSAPAATSTRRSSRRRSASWPGIRKGCVAVFGVADRAAGTERLVVLAETRERGRRRASGCARPSQERRRALLGEPADEVVLAPPHSVPKTSSGKVRRAASRELYGSGRLGRGSAAMGWQLARWRSRGARVQLGRLGRAAWAPLYSGYVWSIFGLIGVPLWLGVALLPGIGRRRRIARAAARLMFRCAGLPLAPPASSISPPVAARAGWAAWWRSTMPAISTRSRSPPCCRPISPSSPSVSSTTASSRG